VGGLSTLCDAKPLADSTYDLGVKAGISVDENRWRAIYADTVDTKDLVVASTASFGPSGFSSNFNGVIGLNSRLVIGTVYNASIEVFTSGTFTIGSYIGFTPGIIKIGTSNTDRVTEIWSTAANITTLTAGTITANNINGITELIYQLQIPLT
jgi:hypothetical protein